MGLRDQHHLDLAASHEPDLLDRHQVRGVRQGQPEMRLVVTHGDELVLLDQFGRKRLEYLFVQCERLCVAGRLLVLALVFALVLVLVLVLVLLFVLALVLLFVLVFVFVLVLVLVLVLVIPIGHERRVGEHKARPPRAVVLELDDIEALAPRDVIEEIGFLHHPELDQDARQSRARFVLVLLGLLKLCLLQDAGLDEFAPKTLAHRGPPPRWFTAPNSRVGRILGSPGAQVNAHHGRQ